MTMILFKLAEAYKLALLSQAVEAVELIPFTVRSPKDRQTDSIYEASMARVLLRLRLLLEDAVQLMEEVAMPFLERT
jgi:hypothetical protein